MERSRNVLRRLHEADSIDWAFAALFFAIGMCVATIIQLVWG